jgi:hypothetical protein
MKPNDNCCAPPEVFDALQRLAPDAPLLALGQTIFWDEPMKLALLHWLPTIDPTRRVLFGVHDTDYFARMRTRRLPQGAQVVGEFALLPHNDGTTRALWSAAGEIAQLFGSETVPTLKMFARYGGQVARVAESCSEGQGVFIDALTEAWGWRGLASRDPAPRPVCEVPLSAVAPALDALLAFGLDGSCQMLDDADARARACQWAWVLRQRIQHHAAARPNDSLADLYVALYPELLESLYGGALPNTVGVTRTTELLRFNTRTAGLPRFALVDAFVNPATRRACEDAYNASVADSPIYTLDEFGEGALPFDLLIPQVGRGTLLLTERYLVVLTPEPQIVRLPAPVGDVHALAQVVESRWGDELCAGRQGDYACADAGARVCIRVQRARLAVSDTHGALSGAVARKRGRCARASDTAPAVSDLGRAGRGAVRQPAPAVAPGARVRRADALLRCVRAALAHGRRRAAATAGATCPCASPARSDDAACRAGG